MGGVSWGARTGVSQQNTGLGVRRPRSWLCRFLHVGQVFQLSQAPVKNSHGNSDAFSVIEMLASSM